LCFSMRGPRAVASRARSTLVEEKALPRKKLGRHLLRHALKKSEKGGRHLKNTGTSKKRENVSGRRKIHYTAVKDWEKAGIDSRK